MKRKQQITHYMPYQSYHPRHIQQQQQQNEPLNNINNNKLAHLIREQQTFVTQSQQNLQPTHNCYEQQQIDPVKSFNTTITATDTFPVHNCSNSTNAKMSSLIYANNFYQTNLQQSIKTEQQIQQQQQQQQQYADYQQDYSYFNNNYNVNNNNNFNCNFSQQQNANSMKLLNTSNNNNNNNSFYNVTTTQQQQEQEAIIIKDEFVEEQKQNEQYECRKRLHLSFPTSLPQQQQTSKINLLPVTNTQSKTIENTTNNVNFNKQMTTTTTTTNNDNNNPGINDKITMDAREIANFLANELFMQQLVSMDGIQSGVPTLTTSTLTPTTLRSIEETFIHLTSEPVNAPYQAGFIPPPLGSFSSTPTTTTTAGGAAAAGTVGGTGVYNNNSLPDFGELTNHDTESDDDGSQSSWNAQQFNEDNSLATTDNSSAATDTTSFQNGSNGLGGNVNSTSNASSTNDFTNVFAVASAIAKQGANNNNNNNLLNNNNVPRRNMGGRRPAKSTNMTPEEEEKRRIRRERNKEAAARCRKRRVDQTNELLEEVAQLEKKREMLQKDIESLNTTKQDLEYILEAHRPSCQKIRNDLLSVNTIGGLIAPTTTATTNTNTNNNNNNSNNNNKDLALPTGQTRSMSPIDIKPIILHDQILNFIKNEPLESALDSNSSLDHDGPSSPKRLLLSSSNNPMIPPPLPLPNVASITASLNTPIVTTAPVSFNSFNNSNATLNTLNALNTNHELGAAIKPRPNSLPTKPRNSSQLALNVDGKAAPPTDINGVEIQTPSRGAFNYFSLMDGGTGLTPVSEPLVPNCSSQNKHPLELATPTSEPSKLVSL